MIVTTACLRRALPAALLALVALSAPAAAAGDVVDLPMTPEHRASPSGQVVQTPPHAGAWSARCVSAARTEVPDCGVEQRMVLRENGKLLAGITVTLTHGSNTPTILVQVPLGLALDKGIVLKLDNRGPATLRVQTCDQSGCYGATVLSKDFLAGMLAGKRLDVRFVGTNGRPVTVPVPLEGFAAAYARIK